MKKILLTVAVLGLAALVAAPGIVDFHLRDAGDPDDADLARPALTPAPEPNAFDALGAAAEALAGSDGIDPAARDLLETDPFESDPAAALLSEHAAALGHFEAALRAPGFRMPDVAWDEDLPDLQPWFTAARLYALGALVRAHAGDGAGAAGELLELLRLGHAVQSDPTATMIHVIVGAELKEVALRTLSASTAAWQPTARASRRLSGELAAFRTDPAAWRNAWAGEYRNVKAGLLASAPPAGWTYSYQPNRTLALQATHTRALQARAGQPCQELQPDVAEEPTRIALLLRALRPNAVGEILAEVARPNGNRFALRRCAADTLLASTQLVLALRAHSGEHEDPPADLSDLVPDYLAELPTGAYDASPLRLDTERRVLVASGSSLPEATLEQRTPEYALPF